MKNKFYSAKRMYTAWAIALLATTAVVRALTISYCFFVVAVFFVRKITVRGDIPETIPTGIIFQVLLLIGSGI